MACPALADSVVSGLMAPVVVAPADDQAAFVPNYLGADGKARCIKTCLHLTSVKRAMPGVDDVAGKQLPSLTPIGSIIIQDCPSREVAWLAGEPRTPCRVILHAIGSV